MVKVAEWPLTAPHPIGVVPSRKVTAPVGAPSLAETVAVKVRAIWATTGFALELTLVADPTWLITIVPLPLPV